MLIVLFSAVLSAEAALLLGLEGQRREGGPAGREGEYLGREAGGGV